MQHDALNAQLRTLKLTGMADALEQQLEQPATHDDLSFVERLSLLIDREACSRSNSRVARLLKAAQLKIQAQPDDVNYRHPRGLKKGAFAALLSGQWISGHQNVFLTGPTGCGKTYLGCVLATQACRQGYSVRYFRTSRLLETLSIAHHDGRFSKLIAQLAKTDVLLLDDWGLEKTRSWTTQRYVGADGRPAWIKIHTDHQSAAGQGLALSNRRRHAGRCDSGPARSQLPPRCSRWAIDAIDGSDS